MTPSDGQLDAPRATWQRDLFHLLVGSATGLIVGLVFHRMAVPEDQPELVRMQRVHEFVEAQYVREVAAGDLVDEALRGMVESLDPYSRYYSRDELRAMERETSGHYQGIGVVFARPVREAEILFTLSGSPADQAGIGVGDRFVEVDGWRTSELADGELHDRIGGPDASSPLPLRVADREGNERDVLLERSDLIDPTVRHAEILDDELGVGYLAITSFSKETPTEFDAAWRDLEQRGARSLVVDVRGNLGGVLRSAVTLVNRFVSEGLIVSQEGRGPAVRYEARAREAWYEDTPLVVIVNGESASASEVFAAALQDHRAAVVVGGPSYGKGMVQQVRDFDGEAAVKLTTAYYYTPSHRNLERSVAGAWESGIVPDLSVPMSALETRTVHQFLLSYGPPPEALAEIRAWEAEDERKLLTPRPPDAQLDAAVALFRGERPGSYVAEIER